jgi:DNA-binding NarL/FixJ family response regulator
MFEDDDSVFSAMRAGARGYLLKDADRDELARAIDTIGHGGAIFGASVARRVQAFFSSSDHRITPFPDLTARELEVLDRIARGEANPTIARHLGISPKTVRNHVSTILDKLMVADRSQAFVRAREAGLGTGPSSRPVGGIPSSGG